MISEKFRADRGSPKRRATALAVFFVAVVLMIAVGTDLIRRSNSHNATPAAKAIVAGYERSRTLTQDDAEDQNLREDEEDAGALWAKTNRPEKIDECPSYSPAFRRGCEGFVRSADKMPRGGH